MFHGAPFVMVTESQQAWSFWSSFCYCKISIPFLCPFSLCTKILLCTGSYMYACDTYIALTFLLLLVTSQLVDVT